MRLSFLESPKEKTREVVRFAYFPTKMETGELIWLEKYISKECYYEGDEGFGLRGWEVVRRDPIIKEYEVDND